GLKNNYGLRMPQRKTESITSISLQRILLTYSESVLQQAQRLTAHSQLWINPLKTPIVLTRLFSKMVTTTICISEVSGVDNCNVEIMGNTLVQTPTQQMTNLH